MTANVNQEQCIGCGYVWMAPVFRMNDNGLSETFGLEANIRKQQ